MRFSGDVGEALITTSSKDDPPPPAPEDVLVTLVGDWTNGDPAITRLLERRGRAGVPLYLWYQPGKAEPEELPQVLTAGMLIERANRVR